MNLKRVPRTMIDGYLRAIRVPVDGAVRLLLARDRPTRGKVELAIDRTDATVRALSGVILRDEILVESAKQRRPTPGPAADQSRSAGRARKSGRANRREHTRQPDESAPHKARRPRHKADRAPAGVGESPTAKPTATTQTPQRGDKPEDPSSRSQLSARASAPSVADPPYERSPQRPSSSTGQPFSSSTEPPSAPSTELPSTPRRAPASTERASRPPSQLPSTSSSEPSSDVSTSSPSGERPTGERLEATSGGQVAGTSETPSLHVIAARAYEIYQEGRPGTAEDHWKAAEEELLARDRKAG
jgi:Protein of unknown function (DUF2934)